MPIKTGPSTRLQKQRRFRIILGWLGILVFLALTTFALHRLSLRRFVAKNAGGAAQAAEQPARADALRIRQLAASGDLSGAIAEARRAAAASRDPGLKLGYAKLLLRYHAATAGGAAPQPQSVEAYKEMAAIVDELQSTPEAQNALAFGLGNLQVPGDVLSRWIDAAMADLSPSNRALLPAAEAAVRDGRMNAQQVHARVGPAFAGAPLDQRAAYALWLSSHDLHAEALGLLTPLEGAADPTAFAARASAMAGTGDWGGIIAAADQATALPESIRLLTRARAEAVTDGREKSANSVRLGLQAAAREGRLVAAVGMADKLAGGPDVTDEQLILLSRQPRIADTAFRLLRARWSRAKGTDALVPVWEAAQATARNVPAVRDFGRYVALTRGEDVEEGATRDAVDANPADVDARITRAFHLLRLGKPEEADAMFDGVTVFYETLSPGQQAVVAAVKNAAGQPELAKAMLLRIDTRALNSGEYGLLRGIVPPQ